MAAAIHFSATHQWVLVTGATGFIGQSLVRALLADGLRVILLTRRPRHAACLFDGQALCIADMWELPPTQRVDAVINLAGARILGWRWTGARRAALRHSRVDLTRTLVEWIAAADHKPQLLFSASAVGYYGVQARDDGRALTEDSPPQPIFMSELCKDWEEAAQAAAAHDVTVVRMRFGLVLGHGGALPMLLLPVRLGLGGRLGSGRQSYSWIHLQDLLRAIAFLWRRFEQGEVVAGAYNFTAPEVVSQLQFNRTATALLHRPCVMPMPAWPVRLGLGEQADLLLEGQRVVPAHLQRAGFEFTFPTLEAALRNLL